MPLTKIYYVFDIGRREIPTSKNSCRLSNNNVPRLMEKQRFIENTRDSKPPFYIHIVIERKNIMKIFSCCQYCNK